MKYHVVHRQPNLSTHYDWGVSEGLLKRMVNAYLRGETEIMVSGQKFRVGSTVFKIYEDTTGGGFSGVLTDQLKKIQLLKAQDVEEHFERFHSNITDTFLRGMNWGDLKEDLYNVYLNTGARKRVKLAIEKDELTKFIQGWHEGDANGWLGGSVFQLKDLTALQIFDINIDHRMESNGETKKHLKNEKNLRSQEWSITIMEIFGKDVTSNFKIGTYGSKSKPMVPTTAQKIDWSLIHSAIRNVTITRFESQHFADSVEAAFKEINDVVKKEYQKINKEELDGAKLMRTVFSPTNPKIKLTDNVSESEKNIQEGYMSIFAGTMIGIRNPKAHANVVIGEIEAWEKIVLASHLMKMWDARLKTN